MRRGITTQTALERAKVQFRGHGLLIRGELRQRGVRGDLRRFDDRASGQRGTSEAKSIYAEALEVARHGLPMDVALALRQKATEGIYRLAYDEAEREGYHGPRAA